MEYFFPYINEFGKEKIILFYYYKYLFIVFFLNHSFFF